VHQAYRSALITGASSGIGEHIARLAAADGIDLVIVARRAERLDRLAVAMRVAHQVNVEVLTADLTTETGVAAVQSRLAEKDRPIELRSITQASACLVSSPNSGPMPLSARSC